MKLGGRVAIVTGAASGIGRGVALRLAREGATVVGADINEEQGKAVVAEIQSLGRESTFIRADVRKSNEVNAMAENVLRDLGKIDILVNCAGGSARGRTALFHDSSEEVWDYVIELNLKGTRNCCRAVIGAMMQQRYGKIVSIASIAGTGAHATLSDYCVAKAGILALSRVLALEAVGYGINVNCVSPGPTDTPAMQPGRQPKLEERINSTGFGRLATVEEVANAVAFLVSDEASFITGQNYPVCGIANIAS